MKEGYIKLHRQLQDCWIWTEDRFSRGQAWVDMILMANHSDKKVIFKEGIITVERGQFITSIRKLADRWQWSVNTVRKFLTILESDGMITRESNSKRTVICITQYEKYQGFEGKRRTLTDTPSDTPSEHQVIHEVITNNNDNNVKNDKNDKEPLEEAIERFKKHRQKIKAPMTDYALKLFRERLNKLTIDESRQIQLIDEAILRGWKTVYPVDNSELAKAEKKYRVADKFKELEEMAIRGEI